MLPDAFAQFGARKDPARLPHKHLQQYQLARRQLDFSPVAMQSMIYQLKREITDAQGECRHFRHNGARSARTPATDSGTTNGLAKQFTGE
jgi:hypothetical protein